MSALNISDLNPTDYPYYFIDSNIWLAYFKSQRADKLSDAVLKKTIDPEREYIDYLIWFEELINTLTTRTDIPGVKHHRPKIIFTSLLSTEIINAYSRNISWKLFKYENEHKSEWQKQVKSFKSYRRTPHYKKELNMLIDDLTALKDLCMCSDDNFRELDFFNTISGFTNKFDFNDFFYMNACKKNNCPIVTHDGDFDNPYSLVFTKNRGMLGK